MLGQVALQIAESFRAEELCDDLGARGITMYKKAPARPAAPTASAKTDGPQKPGASLSIGVKEGDKLEFHDLTGLFDAKDKKGGDYFRVSVKEELYIPAGAEVYLRTNADVRAKTANLSYGVGDGKGKMSFTDVLNIPSATDKNGKNYFKDTVTKDVVIPAGSLMFLRPKG